MLYTNLARAGTVAGGYGDRSRWIGVVANGAAAGIGTVMRVSKSVTQGNVVLLHLVLETANLPLQFAGFAGPYLTIAIMTVCPTDMAIQMLESTVV